MQYLGYRRDIFETEGAAQSFVAALAGAEPEGVRLGFTRFHGQ